MVEFEEKNNDTERIILDLKNQFLVAKKAEKNIEQQLKKRIQEFERLEEEIMCLRKKLDEEYIKSKFQKNSNILDEILSVQRSSSDKTRLGFDKEKPGHSSYTNQDGNKEAMLLHSITKLKGKKVRNVILSYKEPI